MHRDGDVAACVASVSGLEEGLTPDRLEPFQKSIAASPLLIVDTNLSPAALAWAVHIAHDAGVPVILEAVSIVKCMRYDVNYARTSHAENISDTQQTCKIK